MATRTPRAGTTLCCITLGVQDFVLSLEKGLKMMALLKDAVECDREYHSGQSGYTYHPLPDQPRISMDVLQAGQFKSVPRPNRVKEADE